MEISSLPPNFFHRLMLANGQMILRDQPLPGGKPEDPKVFLILFTPAKTDSSAETGEDGEIVGETRWTVPARYCILMREANGDFGEQAQVHYIESDKVVLASRLTSRAAAISEFRAILQEELEEGEDVNVPGLSSQQQQGSNGQAAAATP